MLKTHLYNFYNKKKQGNIYIKASSAPSLYFSLTDLNLGGAVASILFCLLSVSLYRVDGEVVMF